MTSTDGAWVTRKSADFISWHHPQTTPQRIASAAMYRPRLQGIAPNRYAGPLSAGFRSLQRIAAAEAGIAIVAGVSRLALDRRYRIEYRDVPKPCLEEKLDFRKNYSVETMVSSGPPAWHKREVDRDHPKFRAALAPVPASPRCQP